MSDLKLPNVPEGYFWVVKSDNPGKLNAKCYVRLKRRTFLGLLNKTVAYGHFYITHTGSPMHPVYGCRNAEEAITNIAAKIYRKWFYENGPSVTNYTGTYYTD